MSIYHFYVHNKKVLIPTVCQTESGVYLDDAPVTTCETGNQNVLEAVLLGLLSSPNPKIPNPPDGLEAGSAILDLLSLKKWSAFEKQATMYTIHADSQRLTIYITGRGSDGMWKQEFQRESSFEASTPHAAIVGFLLAEIAKDIEDGEQVRKPLLLPPPPAI